MDVPASILARAEDNQLFRIPLAGNWVLPKAFTPSIKELFRDRGDDVARDFFALNPHLPPAAFTIHNLIVYTLRIMFAKKPEWKDFPAKWAITIGLDDIQAELQNFLQPSDPDSPIFSQLLKLGEEGGAYALKAIATKPTSSDGTSCMVIHISRQAARYTQIITIEQEGCPSSALQPTSATKPPQKQSQPAGSSGATTHLKQIGEKIAGLEAGATLGTTKKADGTKQKAGVGEVAAATSHKRGHRFITSEAKRKRLLDPKTSTATRGKPTAPLVSGPDRSKTSLIVQMDDGGEKANTVTETSLTKLLAAIDARATAVAKDIEKLAEIHTTVQEDLRESRAILSELLALKGELEGGEVRLAVEPPPTALGNKAALL
ncbi:MAG: hypothetical protein Q9213_005479 [Squamulea squamosa]